MVELILNLNVRQYCNIKAEFAFVMAQKRYSAEPSPGRNGTERRCSKQGEERAVDLQNRSEVQWITGDKCRFIFCG